MKKIDDRLAALWFVWPIVFIWGMVFFPIIAGIKAAADVAAEQFGDVPDLIGSWAKWWGDQ